MEKGRELRSSFLSRNPVFTYLPEEDRYFIDNIEGKKTDAATAEEGFWSIVVGAAAEESVKAGSVVNIDELLNKSGISR